MLFVCLVKTFTKKNFHFLTYEKKQNKNVNRERMLMQTGDY